MDSNETLDSVNLEKIFDDNRVQSLKPWFERYATVQIHERVMSAGDFQLFLRIEQRETSFFDSPSIESLFQKLTEPCVVDASNERFLTFAGFCRVICCAENALFDPERRAKVNEKEMNRPLAEYWISSSHNTYLEDDQLVGRSSLEQYVDVLLRGCRCVEIDCWDGERGEPIVTHGRTLTSSLRFEDVVRVCRDYAFVASPYPLILSLEVRCGAAQKEKMADILREVLGSMLLQSDPEVDVSITPHLARKKIIVKSRQLTLKWNAPLASRGTQPTGIMHYIRRLTNFGRSRNAVAPTFGSENSKDGEEEVEGNCLASMDSTDSARVVHIVSRKLQNPFKIDPQTCISLNEDKALAFVRQNERHGARKICMEQLMRIYPKPARIGLLASRW